MEELAGVSGGIELELVDIADRPQSLDEVERALVAAGLTVERNGPVMHLAGVSDDELCDLAARAVTDAHARVRRLIQRRRSLDELFSLHAEGVEEAERAERSSGAPR